MAVIISPAVTEMTTLQITSIVLGYALETPQSFDVLSELV